LEDSPLIGRCDPAIAIHCRFIQRLC